MLKYLLWHFPLNCVGFWGANKQSSMTLRKTRSKSDLIQ